VHFRNINALHSRYFYLKERVEQHFLPKPVFLTQQAVNWYEVVNDLFLLQDDGQKYMFDFSHFVLS
jgi:hypothetical protein